MSRIGKKAVPLPKGVTASVDGRTVKVKGPKGELSVKLLDEVDAKVEADGIADAGAAESLNVEPVWRWWA